MRELKFFPTHHAKLPVKLLISVNVPVSVLEPVVQRPEADGQGEDVWEGAAEVERQVELRRGYDDWRGKTSFITM